MIDESVISARPVPPGPGDGSGSGSVLSTSSAALHHQQSTTGV